MVKVQFYTLDDLIEELADVKVTDVREQKIYRDVPLFYAKLYGWKDEVMHTQGMVVVFALNGNEIKFYEDVVSMAERIFLTHSEERAKKLETKVDARYIEIKNKLEESKFKVRKGIYREL